MEDDRLLKPGETFGDYRVVKLLGRGGMGAVYLVTLPSSGAFYALKVMAPPDDDDRHEWRKRFAYEAEFAMRIRHKNLISVYDVGEDPETGLCYIIMDYVPGGTLSARLARAGKLSVREAVGIAVQIANVLDVAHKAGVVHRDVKPDNIMFDEDGTPKLADLGIAKFTHEKDATTTVTKSGVIIGTPAYMSPEQLMDSHNVDARADIYSLGIVLYEMLTGSRPYADTSMVELLAKAIQGDELPNVLTVRPDVPDAVAYALAKMVALKVEARPQTAADAAKLLTDAITGRLAVRRRATQTALRRAAPWLLVLLGMVCAFAIARATAPRPVSAPPPEQSRHVVTNTVKVVRVVTNRVEVVETVPDTTHEDAVAPAAEREVAVAPVAEREGAKEHKKVQLWEGGPYWAETNLGADKPEEAGDYFWWGDTVGYTRQGDAWVARDGSSPNFSIEHVNTPTNNKDVPTLNREGWLTAEGVFEPAHDAAHVRWGGDWRMPTSQELEDLHSKCDWSWTTQNGVNGYLVRGRGAYADKSIFLPAAGCGHKTAFDKAGSNGYYWSSVPRENYNFSAYELYFHSRYHGVHDNYRDFGRSIRPVQGDTHERPEGQASRNAPADVAALNAKTTEDDDGGHKKVQLWEGGPYWAETNLGADKPEDAGYYFWWGDTNGYRETGKTFFYFSFKESNCPTAVKSSATLKYEGWIVPKGGTHVLAPKHDAAHVKWGSTWRMPTSREFDDLSSKCDWSWSKMNGENGYTVRGRGAYANKSIFLPCAGYGRGNSLKTTDSYGLYWSSVPHSDDNNSRYLYFRSGYHGTSNFGYRGHGYSIRPIKDSAHAERQKVQLWERGPYWATTNLGAKKPEEYGFYFWWGDTVGYTRKGNFWAARDGSSSNFSFRGGEKNTPTENKDISALERAGWLTVQGVLTPDHDAAHVQWGDAWRMPTKQELDDLNSKCDWNWTTQNGVNGYIVRGRGRYADKSIFLPTSGSGYGPSLIGAGSYGGYWSSVPRSDSYYAYELSFDSGNHTTGYYGRRFYGRAIRPVQGFAK